MVVFLLERFLGIVIGLYILTQLILPSFTSFEYNWMFKSKEEPPPQPPEAEMNVVHPESPLEKEVDETVSKFKEVKTKVKEHLKDAQDLKDKTDNV